MGLWVGSGCFPVRCDAWRGRRAAFGPRFRGDGRRVSGHFGAIFGERGPLRSEKTGKKRDSGAKNGVLEGVNCIALCNGRRRSGGEGAEEGGDGFVLGAAGRWRERGARAAPFGRGAWEWNFLKFLYALGPSLGGPGTLVGIVRSFYRQPGGRAYNVRPCGWDIEAKRLMGRGAGVVRRIWRLCVWGIVLFGFSWKGGFCPRMKFPVSKHYFLFLNFSTADS